jgi:DNA repair protein RecO (recombination protein O)
MHEEKTEGIVLRSQDFKERHRIITLYSPEGLISLIVKNISRKNTRLLSLTTPFTLAEYHYRRGQSELLSFHDGTLLDDHLILRQSYTSLQAAGALANAILSSQMPGKSSPALFVLYKSYHKQVPGFTDPAALIASFYLKLLKHEGHLTISPHCAICDNTASRFLHEGESLCSKHPAQDAFHFSPAEWELLLTLDNAQQFSILRSLTLPPTFSQKINALFLSRLT